MKREEVMLLTLDEEGASRGAWSNVMQSGLRGFSLNFSHVGAFGLSASKLRALLRLHIWRFAW